MGVLQFIFVPLIICLCVYLFLVLYGMEKEDMEKEDMRKEEIQKQRDNEDLKL